MECLTCLSLCGEKRISPGPSIHEGTHWIIDHAYPTKLLGWLVMVPKRHVEALHDLSAAEFNELGILQAAITKALFQELHCEKEYLVCFAEGKGFHHVHFHVIPRSKNLPEDLKGTGIFTMLRTEEKDAVSRDEIILLSQKLTSALTKE